MIVAVRAGAEAEFQFVDVSSERHIGPYSMAFGMGAGISAADFDGDGYVDVFVPNAEGVPDQLYHNLGNGHFREIAAAAGVDSTEKSRCALWFDYDNDGDLDLLVANDRDGAPSAYHLYRQNAPARFEDVTDAAGLYTPMQPRVDILVTPHRGGLAAADLNNDGYLDVYSAQWNGNPHLFLNNGDGSFTDSTSASQVDNAFYYVHQPVMADFDRDGRIDIHLAVDFLWNALFINNQATKFVDMAPQVGLDNAMNDMGTALADYDNDGDLDIYITNIYSPGQHNVLMRNDSSTAGLRFTEVAQAVAVDNGGWGWGATFLDADKDGWLDIAATNGWGTPLFQSDPSKFFHNPGHGAERFEDVSDQVGFNDTDWGSSLIAFDFDRDGDLDLMQTCNGDGPLRLLENRTFGSAASHGFLVIKPRMRTRNRFAIGAVVRIVTGKLHQMRLITAGTSYLGQEPAEAFFGLGSARIVDRVLIEWPDGSRTQLENIAANRVITVTNTRSIGPNATLGNAGRPPKSTAASR